MSDKIYPRTSDKQTVYLKNVVTNANIEKGVWIFTLLFSVIFATNLPVGTRECVRD